MPNISQSESRPPPGIADLFSSNAERHVVRLSGEWSIRSEMTPVEVLLGKITPGHPANRIVFECSELKKHDSLLIAFLLQMHGICAARGIILDADTLPAEVAKLLALALARPEKISGHAEENGTFFHRIGEWGEASWKSWLKAFDFLGQTAVAFSNLARGRARTRLKEVLYFMQAGGVDALPITSLIAFLTGLILAYIGAVQMTQFGATVYVGSLVGLAMVREMGVLMASIILCGRTATAYAAQLGSMQASEEISAFRVLGINPVEYLVLPRIIAIVLMLPLLTLYADFCGIIGGMVVMTSMDVTFEQYFRMVELAVNLPNFFSGIIKSFFFALLISWAGCFRGMTCGKSAEAVGSATTSASVMGMTLIVIADAVFAVLFNIIKFY